MGRLVDRWFGYLVLLALAAVMAGGFLAQAAGDDTLHGAGATFPAPLYARWIALFERETGTAVSYDAIGSGGGIDAILTRDVAFGASDALLTDDDRAEADDYIYELPMVLGPVVVVYNLPDLDERLVLDGETLVGIYLGEITRWDDPAISATNAGRRLPDLAIHVTHRADSSGTTGIFTDYLSAVSETWADSFGSGKTVDWPVSGGSGLGNDGIAQQVLVQPGGIGYVEASYAELSGLEYAALINKDGAIVLPSVASVQAAERNTPSLPGTDRKPSIVNAGGSESYPIAGFTYVLVYRDLSYLS